MKFTLNWLKRHLDTTASLDEICEKLTAIGLEVESLKDPASQYAPFKVAYVESAEKHPDADKLRVCMVKTDQGMLQVVCGAHNARAGMKAIFAPEGTYIPGLDVVLKKASIRGVESNGMLVSEREMMLSDEHAGIIDLDGDYEIGTPLAQVFGLDDPVIEINLTPNRIDCAGVRGIARDLAAAGLGTLKKIEDSPVKGNFPSPISVSIEDDEGCPLFLGRYIKGVKNGPSPAWLQALLKSVGLRPISALVDITNFLSLDHARPLHVFDADKIKGGIVVRQTKQGEKLDALNDKSYEISAGHIGICDDSRLLGLGGIVGGVSTGCTENTVNVFIEAAYFNPMRIARSGRDLGIDSDARYRFERGIDPAFTVAGMELATKLVLELCGGEASNVVQAGSVPDARKLIAYDPAFFQQLMGFTVPLDRQMEILGALGFETKAQGNQYNVIAPSWRGDIMGKADLVEEIVRIHGFDKIPSVSVRSENTVSNSAETTLLAKTRQARSALTAAGLDECVTWSFLSSKRARQFGVNDNATLESLSLKNPISSELDVMRPSILPNLIEAAMQNEARGHRNAALCEIGPVFRSVKPEGQAMVAAGVRVGQAGLRSWADAAAARDVDAFDAKADALAALAACGAPAANAQVTRSVPDYYHPGRAGALQLGKNVLAYFGEIHPGVLDEMDVKTPVVAFEIFLQNIPEAKKKPGTEKQLLKLEPLQPLTRDFAFIVDAKVSADDVIRTVMGADKKLIVGASVFDVYAGKGVEDGKKSLAVSVTIQPREQSLTDAEIEAIAQKITQDVLEKIGGTLRG